MSRAGIMFSLIRGLAPFKERKKCLVNIPKPPPKASTKTFARSLKNFFQSRSGTALLSSLGKRPAFKSCGNNDRTGLTNVPRGTNLGHDPTCLRPGPSDQAVAWKFWRGRASSSSTTIVFGGTCAIISARPKNVKSFLRVRTKLF